jgi:hypothetical protein
MISSKPMASAQISGDRRADGSPGGDSQRGERGTPSVGIRGGRSGTINSKQRGLQWSFHEAIALVESYAFVSFDSVAGANQKAAEFFRCIEERFLNDSLCPPRAEFDKLPIGSERTRWHGRGERAVRGRMILLKKEMVRLYACRCRIDAHTTSHREQLSG